MPGMLTFKELQAAVAAGEIDTVIVCFPDMQGRLIGKRFQAEYFLEGAHDETHGCDYLLANDIDMEPVPGYAAANWEKGYGDFVMKPDMATLRRLPWLPGTALVLCRHPRPSPSRGRAARAARHPEEAGRAARGDEDVAPSSPRSSSSISSTRATSRPPTRAIDDLKTAGALYRGLPHLPDHQGRGGDAGDPHRPARAPASRSRIRRANGGRARRRSTSATPTRSPWPTATSS